MVFRLQIALAVFLLLTSASGCKSADQEKAVQSQEPAGHAQQITAQQSAPAFEIKGKILETMDVGTYTYAQIDDNEGPVWVAVPKTAVEKGQEVTLTNGMEMQNFESKTLRRTFDKIFFAGGFDGGAASADPHAGISGAPKLSDSPHGESFEEALVEEGASSGPMVVDPSQLTGGSKAAVVSAEDVKVKKAEGENAYTVGDVFAKGKELDSKKVKVRGKVVKVSTMIMGKNWLHIQDGTGDAATGTNDLVVTTMAEPAKGTVVVVEGTLHADKDFGAGYRYDVIVEDAELK